MKHLLSISQPVSIIFYTHQVSLHSLPLSLQRFLLHNNDQDDDDATSRSYYSTTTAVVDHCLLHIKQELSQEDNFPA